MNSDWIEAGKAYTNVNGQVLEGGRGLAMKTLDNGTIREVFLIFLNGAAKMVG